MTISETKQKIRVFLSGSPRPDNPALRAAWPSEYTRLWNQFPWYYRWWSRFATYYVMEKSMLLRLAAERLLG